MLILRWLKILIFKYTKLTGIKYKHLKLKRIFLYFIHDFTLTVGNWDSHSERQIKLKQHAFNFKAKVNKKKVHTLLEVVCMPWSMKCLVDSPFYYRDINIDIYVTKEIMTLFGN